MPASSRAPASDIETVMAAKPSVILALPLDPTTSAEAFQPGGDDGVKLVFLSNVPAGYKQGKDYVAIVTDDLFQMGKQAADALAESIGNKGKVAWIFHDAQILRDQPARQRLQDDHREGLSGHRDRRRAGHRRSGPRRRDRQRPAAARTPISTASTSPGPSRPKACSRRCARPATPRPRSSRSICRSRSRSTWSRAAMSPRSSPTRPMSSAAPWRRRRLRPARQGGAGLHRRAGDHRDQGERRRRLAGIAQPRCRRNPSSTPRSNAAAAGLANSRRRHQPEIGGMHDEASCDARRWPHRRPRPAHAFAADGTTTGPNGERATPASSHADAGGGSRRSRRASSPPPSSGTR